MKEIQRYKIRLPKYPGIGIQKSNGYFSDSYDKDFYINIPIFKEDVMSDYVNVFIDPNKLEIKRQFINPYYIELGFFKNTSSILRENSNNRNSVEEKSYNYNLKINGLPLVRKNQLESGELEFDIPTEENLIFLFKIQRMGLRVNRDNTSLGKNIAVYIKPEDRLRITTRFVTVQTSNPPSFSFTKIVGKFIEIRNTPHLDGKYNVTSVWFTEGEIGAFFLNSEDNEKFYENFIIDEIELIDLPKSTLLKNFPVDEGNQNNINIREAIENLYENGFKITLEELEESFPSINFQNQSTVVQAVLRQAFLTNQVWYNDRVSAVNGKIYLIP